VVFIKTVIINIKNNIIMKVPFDTNGNMLFKPNKHNIWKNKNASIMSLKYINDIVYNYKMFFILEDIHTHIKYWMFCEDMDYMLKNTTTPITDYITDKFEFYENKGYFGIKLQR